MSTSFSNQVLILKRRAFLAGIGSAAILVSSCRLPNETTTADPISSEIEKIVQAKRVLISDANRIATTNPELTGPIHVIVDHNLTHIAALSQYLPKSASSSPQAGVSTKVDLPGLATRCAVFSTNHLLTASGLPDPELSRILALIAGSEMQHHALLTGFIL